MVFNENDIKYDGLSSDDFEELCFDLLLSFGFKGLVWRQGGADNGRDIEGRYTVNNPLVGPYEERWFFECKHFSNGVPPEQLYSKIAWADAENPKHLVIFTSAYLTNNARTWLEKITINKPYKVHVIEGKNLKLLILGFQDLVSKYFADKYYKLLLEAMKNWLVHDLLPEPETLCIFSESIDPNKLAAKELAFIWCSSLMKYEEINQWCSDNKPFSFDFLFNYLCQFRNSTGSVITDKEDVSLIGLCYGLNEWSVLYQRHFTATVVLNSSSKPRLAIYTFVKDSEGEGIEVLIEATGDYTTKIRHIPQYAKKEMGNMSKLVESFK